MTYYSTLLEAYGTDNFEKKKKKKEKADDNINIEEYNKDFEHCEPLQAPHYKIPISDKSLENYNNAYQIFLKERKVVDKNEKYDNDNIVVKKEKTNDSNNPNNPNINIYSNYDHIKNQKINNVEPYYDEDLDSYLNINDFNKNNIEVKKVTDDDYKKELMKNKYELKTQDTFNYKEKVEDKKETVKRTLVLENDIVDRNKPQIKNNITLEPIEVPEKIENKEGYKNYENMNNDSSKFFYKNLINILLFIFIGILIIYLLDLLTELALHKGMKKTLDTLMPLIEELKSLKDNK